MAKTAVVCIHGIWMTPGVFFYVRSSLQHAGYSAQLFQYASIRKPLDVNVQALSSFIKSIDAEQIDFVAHSLGGLLLLHYFMQANDPRLGKVVLMGTPLRGSAIARICAQNPLLRPLLGFSGEVLQRGIEQWSAPNETIMIAGTRRWGLGRMFFVLKGAHDGTVAVDETRHPRLAAHYEISVSHTSMLYSRSAMRIILDFLQ